MAKKWYVNCNHDLTPFNVQGKPTFPRVSPATGPYGGDVEITAVIQSTSRKTFQSVWSLTPDGNNLPNGDLPAFPAAPAALTHANVQESNGNLGRAFVNTLRLPDVGGDKHTVVCKKSNFIKKQTILTTEIETWRRIWFSIYSTDGSQAGMIGPVTAAVQQAFAQAFIDLVPVQEVQLNYPHTFALIDEVGNNSYRFPKAIHGGAWPALERKPFHLLINLVKKCAKVKTVNYSPALVNPQGPGWTPVNMTRFQANDGSAEAWMDMSDGSWWIEFTLPNALGSLLFDNDNLAHVQAARGLGNYTFGDSFVRITADDNGAGAQDISAHRAQISACPNQLKFRLHLAGPLAHLAATLTNQGHVAFDFDIEVADIAVAGQNSGNMVTVQTHTLQMGGWVPLSTPEVANIVIHEIGHALGLVPQALNTQSGPWNHPTHYVGHGGVGNHCSLNTASDPTGNYVHNGGGTMCVMYHQVHAQAGPAFCANCMRALKTVPLRRADLQGLLSKGWDKFTS